ncbi:hypothetical protein OIO90_005295 [Microbotryomycetes sp. JL221]|nr:hypothetical protein OIO90_005295 [Microbotryomycetes sp. JL221]
MTLRELEAQHEDDQSTTRQEWMTFLAQQHRQRCQDSLLEGDTPINSAPASEYGGPTRVGSPVSPNDVKHTEGIQEIKWSKTANQFDDEFEVAEKDLSKPDSIHIDQLEEEREGGVNGWLTVMTFGVFQLEYKANLLYDYEPSTISWIGSVHLFLTFGLSLVSGYLFSRGWLRYQLAFGSIVWILGLFMLSISKHYVSIFLSHSLCLGIGVGSCFGPCVSATAQWFSTKRALVLGMSTASAGFGAVIFPIFLSKLFTKIGFSSTIRSLAYLEIPLLIISNIFIRPKPVNVDSLATDDDRKPTVWKMVRSFGQDTIYVFVCVGCFFAMIGCFIPLFYVNAFARAKGLGSIFEQYSLSIINGTAIIFRIASGLLADKFGVLNCAIPFTFLLSLLVFTMPTALTSGGFVMFLIMFGVASGGFISLMPSCFLCTAQHVSEFGLRSGIGFFAMAIAALIGSPIAGQLLALSSDKPNYMGPCCFGGASAMLGCVCLVGARVCLSRQLDQQHRQVN